jgi:hypothetical protein
MRVQQGFVLVAAAAMALTGCSTTTPLGDECTMVRRDPADTDTSDGIRSIPLKEREITANKDFISFGATDCEDLTCVRDASDPKGPVDEADAVGFCTRPCLHTNPQSCLTGNDKIDKGDNPFVCRPLLLDEDTLATLRAENPDQYRQYFGDTQSPYFCARKVQPAQ